MHQRIFRPIYIFSNYAYFLDFCAQKFLLIFLKSFLTSKSPAFWGFKVARLCAKVDQGHSMSAAVNNLVASRSDQI